MIYKGGIMALLEKAITTIKTQGVKIFTKKTISYIKTRVNSSNMNSSEMHTYADVLFINGCPLPHPHRYRVIHQREQLSAVNLHSEEIYYEDIDPELVHYYNTFIIYRVPITPAIETFIKIAKSFNKSVIFDIDDLIIDTKYTNQIPHIKQMSVDEKALYDDGVNRYRKTMQLCDSVITTTKALEVELLKYMPRVFINRNIFSDQMLQLSQKACLDAKKDKSRIVLGYFSGSITHNADFEMILPVLLNLLSEYENLHILLMGEISLPTSLTKFSDRILFQPFVDWKELPEIIASVDINLAPLTESIFNECKSENKWTEAALVRIPTVASAIGAFSEMIEHEKTGILCNNLDEWGYYLKDLINHPEKRDILGRNAYEYVLENCNSFTTGQGLKHFIKEQEKTKIAFIFPSFELSGGVLVALKHCEILQKNGFAVTAINTDSRDSAQRETFYGKTRISSVLTKDTNIVATFDKIVGTMWVTVDYFPYLKCKERYYLVQNYESHFYEPGSMLRVLANATYNVMNTQYITISKWCEKWLKENFGKIARYAPNGLNTTAFYEKDRDFTNKIIILIEGDSESEYKNVDEAFKIVELLDSDKYEIWYVSYNGKAKNWYKVDKYFNKVPYDQMPSLYRDAHILLKTSILESFSYPPLEMLSTGGYVVARANGGNVEYLEHENNCLFYDPDDLNTGKEAIERIVYDHALRTELYRNGIEVAKARDWNNCESEIIKLYR